MRTITTPLICGLLLVLQHPAGPLTSTRAFLLSLVVFGVGYASNIQSLRKNFIQIAYPWTALGVLTIALGLFFRQWSEVPVYANGTLVRSIFLLLTFSLLALSAKSSMEAVTGIAVAVSVYVALNFVGAILGISSDAIETTTAGSRAMGQGERLLVPFSWGLVSFPCVAGIGLMASLLGLKLSFHAGFKQGLAINAFCGVLCAGAMMLAEMRAALLLVFLPLVLIDVKGRWVKLGVLASWVGMCVLPLLYWNMWFVPFSEGLIPNFMHETFSRYSDDILYLNGRAYIYDYGLALLGSHGFPVFGMGFDGRDSGPVLVTQLGLWESSWIFCVCSLSVVQRQKVDLPCEH